MFERILVVDDLTSRGPKALEHAIELSKKHKGKVLVLSVYDVSDVSASKKEYARINWYEDYRKRHENAQKECEKGNVACKQEILEGNLQETVMKVIEENKIDTFVVGRTKANLKSNLSDLVTDKKFADFLRKNNCSLRMVNY